MNKNYRDDLAKRLKTVRSVDKNAAEMVLERESDTEEYKRAKKAHLQEREVETESLKLKNNLNSFEREITETGGEERINKSWSSFDEKKKKEILEKIDAFARGKKVGTEEADRWKSFMFDPAGMKYSSEHDGSQTLGRVANVLGVITGITPGTGLFGMTMGQIQRGYNSIGKKIEENKLARLEKKYQ